MNHLLEQIGSTALDGDGAGDRGNYCGTEFQYLNNGFPFNFYHTSNIFKRFINSHTGLFSENIEKHKINENFFTEHKLHE